ncbi:exodeoxyribonuclease VII small subunit [Caldimicrobium thiodismutans]|jgi:exodeoxyribonuclease VII small subunit|uniref:Exodeoxyribonuclease 7 small subunit n=1 Tax=Caldimicrobium thiodismutans TaxID=1653476 RepID=A0A0U5AME1_9BACT|nr:exodeoxyribonuclease VII small subunit [Caldimicrobium thiodismutans]BAU22978.1 exodeoxyribonuclease VII small subunit [Caldimicrobium thiodismutans]
MSIKDLSQLSFESALNRLEEILRELEQKDLELEKAIALYEEGVKLIHLCENRLKEARLKVEVILKEKDTFILEDLDSAKEKLKNG